MRDFTADEAASKLGVTKATLYAYTSRGLLQSHAVRGKPRERRYHPADLQRLLDRKEARRDPLSAAARSLDWGSPVLDSAITLIQNKRVYYRGRDALKLAESMSLEQVAELLWGVPLEIQPIASRLARLPATDPVTRMQAALPLAAARDMESLNLHPAAVCRTGARILQLFTTIAAERRSASPAHESLQAAWAPKDQRAAQAIRTALVLCADHELNVSTFAARCAASAGASPYDVVSAALATLKGGKHGGATIRVTDLFAEASARGGRAAIANRLRLGERVPGFGHPLYPGGDPRAKVLLHFTRGDSLIRGLIKAGSELLHESPTLDFGLVAVARAFRLPEHAPLLLFALGRTVGWIAHALEQYASGNLIRPRARYTGIAPEAGSG
jgi:citrate synthase